MPESIDLVWHHTYQMQSHVVLSFASSLAPNGTDVWLTGGIAAFPVYRNGFFIDFEFTVIKKVNVIRFDKSQYLIMLYI